jgi:hypothetical protein
MKQVASVVQEHEAVFHQAQKYCGLLRNVTRSAPVPNALSVDGQPDLAFEHVPFCEGELWAGIVHSGL